MTAAPLGADEFAAAFARRGRALWLLAAAWVGRGDAQDLVQEVARIAWQKRASFAAGSDLGAWLAQIVRHTGANWRRKRRPVAGGPGHAGTCQHRGGLADAKQALEGIAPVRVMIHAEMTP